MLKRLKADRAVLELGKELSMLVFTKQLLFALGLNFVCEVLKVLALVGVSHVVAVI